MEGNQILIKVDFADGADALYVATLIPEPATVVLVVCGCAAMVVMVRVTRAARREGARH
jgi:hypothetical protein